MALPSSKGTENRMFGWTDSRSWRFFQVFGLAGVLLFLSPVFPSQAAGQATDTVRKVCNTDPMISQEQAWRIGDSPLFGVGTLGNPDSLDFYGVRDLLRLSNGTTVVANSGELELIFLWRWCMALR